MTTHRVLEAIAFLDEDGSWTIQIPELTSPAPRSGAVIIATGTALTLDGVNDAAHELATVWLNVDPDAIVVNVTVAASSPSRSTDI